jgi:ATP-dependent DNA helicase RecG
MSVESQGLEFKERIDNFRDVSKTVCAFANAFGGRLVVGIDNNGKITGIPETEIDSLQQRIEGAVQQVSPVPLHRIIIEESDGKKTVVVEVYQLGQDTFCTFNGIVYYRAGSTSSKLEGKTLQDYLIHRHILSFDESRSQAKIEDLDAGKVQEFLKKRSPEVKFEDSKLADLLLSLGLAQRNGDLWIRNTAVLFFAKEPSRFLPQNEIKLARFAGTQPIEIIDSKFVNATLLDNLREAEGFIRKNTRTAAKIEKMEREQVPEYPLAVIREALVNAFTHRDYFSRDDIQINVFEDRIEFLNPGTLPSGLSMKMLGTLSIQRNPLTYRIMRDLDLVEGLGTGIPRMRSAMKGAGLPEPLFEELGSFFRVTLYNRKAIDSGALNERQKRALAYLEKNASISSKEYRKMTDLSNPIAVADLNDLIKKGHLVRIGKTRGAYYIKKGGVNNS